MSLARSLGNVAHAGRLIAHLYSTQLTRSNVRLSIPFTFRSVTKKTCATTERGSGERAAEDIHHASRRSVVVWDLAVIVLVHAQSLARQ